MKIKKLVSAVCLAAGLALALPAAASFHEGNASVVLAADGWQQDDTGWYYLQGSEKMTGLQTINGSTYYFNQQGYRVTGAVTIDNTTYYFNPGTGKLCTGIKGMARISDTDTYYYFLSKKNGTIAVKRWVTHNGKKYYAGENGKIQFGTVKINKKLYHLTKNGMMTSYGKSSYNKKYYYASSNGVLKTGLQTINGNLYYFNPKTGQRQTGMLKVGKYTYYFQKSSGTAARGWMKINNKYYYFKSTTGRRLTGMHTLQGKKYYLDPNNGGARVSNKWVKYSGKYYYFGPDGAMKKGFIKMTNGETYYTDSKGVRQVGWRTIGGHKYYFKKPNGLMKTGWLTKSGKTYYMNTSTASKYYGAAVTGWAKIEGETYYFNTDGTLKKGCWIYDDSSKAYYYLGSSTGKVLKGRQKIDGIWYDLGTTGAYKKAVTGELLIKVNRAQNCITVYRGGIPIKAFVCSTAKDGVSTPTGTFTIQDKLRWHELNGPSWGQYCSHITSSILFHSVPNTRYNDNHSLEWWEYNKLGTAASAGCIRMTVADAKWLYENCPVGTKVIIYDDWSSPGPLGKPTAPKIPAGQNYDPTDPYA